jgi:hypothetical protein
MDDPDFVYTPWPKERRAMMSRIHRTRHGAPPGFSTVYGVHVPHQFSDVVRYWAHWICNVSDSASAKKFVEFHQSIDWLEMPELTKLCDEKREVHRNRGRILRILFEAKRHANQDSR